jgi:hypothetical protein
MITMAGRLDNGVLKLIWADADNANLAEFATSVAAFEELKARRAIRQLMNG